jgi:hypothetical protein
MSHQSSSDQELTLYSQSLPYSAAAAAPNQVYGATQFVISTPAPNVTAAAGAPDAYLVLKFYSGVNPLLPYIQTS